MTIYIYKILTIILSPLIDIYMLIRLLRGKEDKIRIKERFGYSSIKRPNGKLIWFQCASVGETNSVINLIYKILDKYHNNVNILITTGTKTSAKIIANKIANNTNIIHQYTPIDKYFVIKRFLKHWKPNVLITVESEIWPNMITMAHKVCEKVMIVNAKMSKRSYKRWKKFKHLKNKIFDSIDICYVQTQLDQYKLINLGIQNTIYLGNLKFDTEKLPVNEEFKNILLKSINGRHTLLCASSHKLEEEKLLELYKQLKKDFDDLLFIIAIRHSNRSDNIYKLLTKNNFNVSRKSKNEIINNTTNFYIYDEMGEMGTLFDVSKIVLMCGSLTRKQKGHTPVEPARFGCAIITGPYIRNNQSLFKELERNNACFICYDNRKGLINNICEKLIPLIQDSKKVEELGENAKNVCNTFQNTAEKIANNIVLNLEYI